MLHRKLTQRYTLYVDYIPVTLRRNGMSVHEAENSIYKKYQNSPLFYLLYGTYFEGKVYNMQKIRVVCLQNLNDGYLH